MWTWGLNERRRKLPDRDLGEEEEAAVSGCLAESPFSAS